MDTNLAWVGHIRKASVNTGKTKEEAHPYYFELPQREQTDELPFAPFDSFFAAHNGIFHGTKWDIGPRATSPNTDSWRAFEQLRLLMQQMEYPDLTPELFNAWTPHFEDNSQFALLFHWQGEVIAVRNDRPLHCMTFGNGNIIHTSDVLLKILKSWIKYEFDLDCGEVLFLRAKAMTEFQTGGDIVIVNDLEMKFKPRTYVNNNYAGWQQGSQGNATSPGGSASAQSVSSANSEGANETVTYSPSVTKPRRRETATDKEGNTQSSSAMGVSKSPLLLPAPRDVPVVDLRDKTTSASKLKIWRELQRLVIPLRSDLLTYWVASSLGYSQPRAGLFLKSLGIEELALFKGMIGGRPFTERQRMLINTWNHLVKRGMGPELHMTWLKDAFFWHLPRYTRPEVDGNAIRRLQSDLVGFALTLDSRDIPVYFNFNEEKLLVIAGNDE